jgi:hypothetical protein
MSTQNPSRHPNDEQDDSPRKATNHGDIWSVSILSPSVRPPDTCRNQQNCAYYVMHLCISAANSAARFPLRLEFEKLILRDPRYISTWLSESEQAASRWPAVPSDIDKVLNRHVLSTVIDIILYSDFRSFYPWNSLKDFTLMVLSANMSMARNAQRHRHPLSR